MYSKIYQLYHLGFKTKKFTLSTLSRANQNRDWRIWRDFTEYLIDIARKLYLHSNDFFLDLKKHSLCSWLHHYRSLPSYFQMGLFRTQKVGCQNSHPAWFKRKYSFFFPHNQGKSTWCEFSWSHSLLTYTNTDGRSNSFLNGSNSIWRSWSFGAIVLTQ